MGGYSIVLAVAALVTLLVTPLVRRVALRIGAVASAGDARHIHSEAVPTLGGVAMFAGFAVALGVASRIPQFREIFHDTSEPAGVLLAGGVMLVVGMLDDLRDVSPPAKIAGQVLAASVLYMLGVTMTVFRVPFVDDVFVLSPNWQFLVTVAWVVVMANAINLIDGLDGLAAGIVAIAGAALFLYDDRLFKRGLLPAGNIGPLVACLAVGVCVGFLPWNFHRARIFMGDAGALFLGLLMASSTSVVAGRVDESSTGQSYFFLAPLVIPLVVLGVPILDTAFAFARRVVRRTSFASADREHLHHRLVRLGHGHRRAVIILWCWTAVLSAVVLLPTYEIGEGLQVMVPLVFAALALVLYAMFHPGAREQRLEAARAHHPAGRAELAEPRVDQPDLDADDAGPGGEVIALDDHRRIAGG
jgi:UDP-GlcNAc:undecaprenyl-phosphate/decaprenyl-phosphate GlcNAc-1-phosphate transferase